ncbi:hypothetical protein [Streptomyces sp. DH12]|uniref:hypothetical protein n=1 Tax=Streptomyces sp. DH12 TaxID=2857010 RepID=UPI001E2F177B|nr:hypothetical protein [Streptomyces sp. DH12]
MRHHPRPLLDLHWQGYELAADATHRFIWIWHGFNIRLLAVPVQGDGSGYDHGWCYPRDPDAVADAVAAWDADTQDEPMGWHKRPTRPPRRAPRRDEQPEYNAPRCAHGPYLADGCRTINCHEALAYARDH